MVCRRLSEVGEDLLGLAIQEQKGGYCDYSLDQTSTKEK
jgi:hypothetical protein